MASVTETHVCTAAAVAEVKKRLAASAGLSSSTATLTDDRRGVDAEENSAMDHLSAGADEAPQPSSPWRLTGCQVLVIRRRC